MTTAAQKEIGFQALNRAIDAIREELAKSKGELTVTVEVRTTRVFIVVVQHADQNFAQPRTVHERDEKELSSLLDKLARENAEVPGDDDASSEEGEEEG